MEDRVVTTDATMDGEIRELIKDVWNSIAFDILMSVSDPDCTGELEEPTASIPLSEGAEVCLDHIGWHDSDRNKELQEYWLTLSYDYKIALGCEALGPYDTLGY